jgi:hypothetical protein
MHHDIRTVVDRLEKDRCRDCVVDNEWNAVAVRDARERFDVADVAGRISHGLAEHRAGVAVDELLDIGGLVAFGKPHRHALPRKHLGEQRMGGSAELGHRHDVAAEFGDV